MSRRKRMMEDLDRDIRDHIERETRDNIDRGMAPEDARFAALRKFGNVMRAKEDARATWGFLWLEQFVQDVRYGLRMLGKSPGFAAIAILTLALGIGANTAIFSVVHAILLKPLPYPASSRLAIVWSGVGDADRAPSSGFAFEQIRERSRLFEQIGGIWVTNAAVTGADDPQPEPVKLAEVTSGLLSLFCDRPALGRLFVPQDVAPNAPVAVIVSNGLWRRKFGSDPRIVGKTLRLGPIAPTILGVLPEDFRLIFPGDSSIPESPDVYVLLPGRFTNPEGPEFLRVVGRLRPGATFAEAQSEAAAIARQLRTAIKGYGDQNYRLSVIPLHDDDVHGVRGVLTILLGGVGLVLLVACVNVANLLLARAGSRHGETAVRSALGASRLRIIRQFLTESIVLGLLGGAAALVLAWATLKVILLLRPEPLLHLGAIRLDAAAFEFTFAIALLTGFIFGLFPALAAARFDLATAFRTGGRNLASGHRRSRMALVLVEVSLSFALLAGTGLLVRTFLRVLRVDPGFQPANVLSFTPLGGNYRFLHQLQQSLGSLPGVQSVSAVSHLPLDESVANWYDYYWPEGAPPDQQSTVMADFRSVLPGYFKVIGASLIEGRDFTDADDPAHQHVAIVDDDLARLVWPGQNPLGKKLNISDSPAGPYQFQRDWVAVVGVVRHVQCHSLTRAVRPQVYVPFPLAPRPVSFVLRASVPFSTLPGSIRQQVSRLNGTVAATKFIPLSDLVAQARSQSRFVAFLSASLAAIALFMTSIGIYGVVSCLVTLRTGEIGLRMALGAIPADVRRMVLRNGMAPVVFGCLVGIALSVALTPLLAALLFGVRPNDLATLAATALFLSGVGLLACYIPARRAMRVDPMVALRYQ
ncbi:MAG TPA: ABC transporter permease [Candidatus Acidoferrales bacterium]|nr:ABC transporter permease [Candidatus Acidoferrales bacterium]